MVPRGGGGRRVGLVRGVDHKHGRRARPWSRGGPARPVLDGRQPPLLPAAECCCRECVVHDTAQRACECRTGLAAAVQRGGARHPCGDAVQCTVRARLPACGGPCVCGEPNQQLPCRLVHVVLVCGADLWPAGQWEQRSHLLHDCRCVAAVHTLHACWRRVRVCLRVLGSGCRVYCLRRDGCLAARL